MRKAFFASLVAASLVAGAAYAAPYGTSGCGLGSIAFGDKPGIVQIFAATTNGIFGNQTFGITSGTSNCVDTTVGAHAAKVFVDVNREALAKDISRGSGETIATLTWLTGCNDSKVVGSTLQKNFKTIFPTESVPSDAVTASILSSLRSEKSLTCTQLM